MESLLQPRGKCGVIIRTCHLVTMSARTKGSHRGRVEHQVSYGDEQGKKFSTVAIGPLQGHRMVKGRFRWAARLSKITDYFSRRGKNRRVRTGHVAKSLFPNELGSLTSIIFHFVWHSKRSVSFELSEWRNSTETPRNRWVKMAVAASSNLKYFPLSKTHVLWLGLWVATTRQWHTERIAASMLFPQGHTTSRQPGSLSRPWAGTLAPVKPVASSEPWKEGPSAAHRPQQHGSLRSEAAAQLLCRHPPVQLGCTWNTGFSGPCYSLSITMGWKAPVIHHPSWVLSFHVSVPFPWTSHEPHLHGEMTSKNSAPLTKDQHFLLLEKR